MSEPGPFRDLDLTPTEETPTEASATEGAAQDADENFAERPGAEESSGGGDGSSGSVFRQPWIVGAVIVLLAGVAGLWLGTTQRTDDDAANADDAIVEAPDVPLPEETETSPGELFFPGSGGRLYGEQRELPVGTPAQRARVLVDALLAGPTNDDSGLRSPLPAGTRLETVYLMGTTAVLDLRPAEADEDSAEGPPTPAEARRRQLSYGSKQELLSLYSLVNTVALGVEGVDSVQLLWDGRQPKTFAGHVDTTRALAADSSLVAGR